MGAGEAEPRAKSEPRPADALANDADTLDLDIGPFFNTATLSAWLGVHRPTIYRLKRQRVILAITTSDRLLAFPAFQFSHARDALPALPEVLALLDPADQDPVGSALWLNAPARTFNGATPAELLRQGDQEAVLVVARQIAAAWQS